MCELTNCFIDSHVKGLLRCKGNVLFLYAYVTQAAGADVNVPNADGATPVMLAVRDVDLFEGMATLLPWEHRPADVLGELLDLSA